MTAYNSNSPDHKDYRYSSTTEILQDLYNWKEERDYYKTEVDYLRLKLKLIYSSPAWKISKPLRALNWLQRKFFPASIELINEDELFIEQSGPTVIEETKNSIKIESPLKIQEDKPIALIAQWSNKSDLPVSTTLLLSALIKCGFNVILVSACEDTNKLNISEDLTSKISIIRKPNRGYDFGSWSVGLSLLPESSWKNEILILNDSLVGPFAGIEEIIQEMRASLFDITGLTDSLQSRYHIQSFMMHFKPGSFKNQKLKEFWLNIRHQEQKEAVIKAYEIGLSRIAQSQGLFIGAIRPWNLIANYWDNPSVHGWRTLLNRKVPFIKREIFRRMSNHEKHELENFIAQKFNVGETNIKKIFESEN